MCDYTKLWMLMLVFHIDKPVFRVISALHDFDVKCFSSLVHNVCFHMNMSIKTKTRRRHWCRTVYIIAGNLALSRALGDFVFKKNNMKVPEEQIVTGLAYLHCHCLQKDHHRRICLKCYFCQSTNVCCPFEVLRFLHKCCFTLHSFQISRCQKTCEVTG